MKTKMFLRLSAAVFALTILPSCDIYLGPGCVPIGIGTPSIECGYGFLPVSPLAGKRVYARAGASTIGGPCSPGGFGGINSGVRIYNNNPYRRGF